MCKGAYSKWFSEMFPHMYTFGGHGSGYEANVANNNVSLDIPNNFY